MTARSIQLETDLDRSRPFRSLLRVLRPQSGPLIRGSIAFLIKDSPVWVLPVVTGSIIDIVVKHGPLERLWLLAAIAAVVLALNYPFAMIFVMLSSRATRSLAVDLRNALTARLQRLSIGFHNRQSASIMQTKVVRDVENVELLMQQAFPTFLSSAFTLTGAIVITAFSVPAFAVVFLVTVPVVSLLIRYIRRRSTERNERFRLEVERYSAGVGEMAALMPLTRGHGLEDVAAERLRSGAERVREAGRQLDTLNGRFGAFSWLSYQFLGLLCLVAASAASITGLVAISPGQVVILSTYFAVLTNGIVGLLNAAPIFTRGLESIRSIAEIMGDPDVEENAGRHRVSEVRGAIDIRSVTYRYDEGVVGLDDLSLSIAEGETIALVGPSGGGKSTLLNLVLGFVRPTTGHVLLDGTDMNELDLRSVRSFVSVVPQESVLFEGSIRDNVAYGLEGVSDDRVIDALRGANALDILELHGEGLDAVVGDRGTRLSGGQRQRLAIARALVRDPRILVLDEATSALDALSETMVKEALTSLFHDRTTLIAAHRLSTIREADRIAYLSHGRIVELGSHEELMSVGGQYARLVSQQKRLTFLGSSPTVASPLGKARMPRFDLDLAELRDYRPDVSVPEDFDEFWRSTLAEARAFDRQPVLTAVDTVLTGVEVFDVEFPGYGGDSISAWFIVPAGSTGPLPTIVEFNGYGGGRGLPHEKLAWPAAGYAYLFMDTRGQGSVWGTGGVTADPHGSGPSTPGFMTRGIEDPTSYYYRRLFTDAVRAIDAVRSFDQVDANRISVCGGSQGGGIAIAVAGLTEGLLAALPEVPFLCHFARAVGMTGSDPYYEIVRYLAVHRDRVDQTFRTLSYFDGVTFAARATAPSLFSVGLLDPVCPPSTVFAAHNAWAAESQIEIYPFNEHEGGQGQHWVKQAEWLGQLAR